MKIITTSSFYIVNKGVFGVGQIVDINDELAKKLIEQGVAEHIEEQEKEEDKEIKEVIIEEVVEEVVEDDVEEENIKEKKVNYARLRVAELKELLIERGINIPEKARKVDLIKLLED